MIRNGSEFIVEFLERQGITTIAGIPGGANLPLYDALSKSKIRHILARHEQGAGFIAHGMARSSGLPAVCMATSGPGATNLLTAIADAKLDSVPVIAITGQVPTSLIGTDAFQEVDTYGMTLPVTKHNFLVRNAFELPEIMTEAFRLAMSGRPGPILIDVPKDVQKQEFEFESWPKRISADHLLAPFPSIIEQMVQAIHQAQRPIMLVGGGIVQAKACQPMLELAHKNNIPVAPTLMGLGCMPIDDPLYLGMLGMHGARYTNLLMDKADLILALGMRFDDRATGKVAEFCPQAKIIHVDIDYSELNKVKPAHIAFTADVGEVLRELLPKIESDDRKAWLTEIQHTKREHPFLWPEEQEPMQPLNLIRSIGYLTPDNTIVATDVGQHQMWVAQAYPFRLPRTLLTSGGLGTMGFGLPAAIGAALQHPDKTVLCFTGDGSLLMNIQELASLADCRLNVKVILFDNACLGLVRQQQEYFYKQNYMAAHFQTQPDFVGIAESFGIAAHSLKEIEKPLAFLDEILNQPGPALIHIPTDVQENVTPMVPPGAANNQMIGGKKYDKTHC